MRESSICLAPVYVGEELLKTEEFTRGASGGPIQAEEASIERPTSKLAPA